LQYSSTPLNISYQYHYEQSGTLTLTLDNNSKKQSLLFHETVHDADLGEKDMLEAVTTSPLKDAGDRVGLFYNIEIFIFVVSGDIKDSDSAIEQHLEAVVSIPLNNDLGR